MARRAYLAINLGLDFWARPDIQQLLADRAVGQLLREVLRETDATQGQLAAAISTSQGEVSEIINKRVVTSVTVLNRIADGLHMPDHAAHLLFRGRPLVTDVSVGVASTQAPTGLNPVAGTASNDSPSSENQVTSEWAMWSGIRTARLLTTVDSWKDRGPTQQALQALLHQEILMFDALVHDQRQAAPAVSRRQALMTLAALPLTLAPLVAGYRSGASEGGVQPYLSRCAASLTACWHLLKGPDIYVLDQVIPAYLLSLENLVHTDPMARTGAAQLASQAHRICGIIALHRHQLATREQHCLRALHYAQIASDVGTEVSALVSLASTYYYTSEPAQAAETFERANALAADATPLQRSRVQAELSVVYSQLGRDKDALTSINRAEELYPAVPEHDPSFLYAEFTRASLTLERGLAYLALAEHFPTRGYQRVAADVFSAIDSPSSARAPDRIRYEIANHRARAAVLSDDLDAFEEHVNCGLAGIHLLRSTQRQTELAAALRLAAEAWPTEKRLNPIRDQFRAVLSVPSVPLELP